MASREPKFTLSGLNSLEETKDLNTLRLSGEAEETHHDHIAEDKLHDGRWTKGEH